MSEFSKEEKSLSLIGKILSHPARVRILKLLSNSGALTSNSLVKECPLARTTVLQHIAYLTKEEWIKTSSSGTSITYELNSSYLKEVLPVIDTLLVDCQKERKVSSDKDKIKILFLCTGNSCRSQMAEGFIHKYSDSYNITAFSAGTVPSTEINPTAIKVMSEIGVDITKQYPKSIKEYVGDNTIDLVIYVCDRAEKECPYQFPFSKNKIFMPFKDPVSFVGSEEDRLEVFRDIRNQIENKIIKLLEEFPAI